jgi:biopolymer transport protein ExbB/TolQ
MSVRGSDPARRRPLLHWMIFTGATLFAAVLLCHYGLVQQMVEDDPTRISSLIALLYAGTALHCLWRTVVVAREADAARQAARLVMGGRRLEVRGEEVAVDGAGALPRGLVAAHIRDLAVKAALQGPRRLDQMLLLRGLAARLRGSNQFGAFASDTLMKLGLAGTVIGFIMMLAPIAGLDTADRGSIRASMTLMSDGMAVAMYTTLAGLVGSILVRIQYYMLEDATAKLFAFAVGLVEVHVVAALERQADAPL